MLVGARQHVGRFGHEMHAAKHDRVCSVVLRRKLGEFVAVADRIGPADDFIALVVVSENDETVAERGLGSLDHRRQLLSVRDRVTIGQWSLESQHVGPPWSHEIGGSVSAGGWQPGRHHHGGVGLDP